MKTSRYDSALPAEPSAGAIELSRTTLRKMHQNLWWTVGYNVIAFSARGGRFVPIRTKSGDRRAVDVGQHPDRGDQCV